jgi:hypothetical protein
MLRNPMKERRDLAKWVADALAHASMSQSDLARALAVRLDVGFERSKVHKMIADKRKISASELIAIEEITGYPSPANRDAATCSVGKQHPDHRVGVTIMDYDVRHEAAACTNELFYRDGSLPKGLDPTDADYVKETIEYYLQEAHASAVPAAAKVQDTNLTSCRLAVEQARDRVEVLILHLLKLGASDDVNALFDAHVLLGKAGLELKRKSASAARRGLREGSDGQRRY